MRAAGTYRLQVQAAPTDGRDWATVAGIEPVAIEILADRGRQEFELTIPPGAIAKVLNASISASDK